MNIERLIITPNQYSRPQTVLKNVKGIVIHWIGNAGTDALANRNYFENLKKQQDKEAISASAHFIVGLRGNIIQLIPTSEMAYHCGANVYTQEAVKNLSVYPNNCTIGIELCHQDESGKFTQETLASGIELTAQLCKDFRLIPKKDIYRHFDITGKNCPKYFVENKKEWESFTDKVEDFFNSKERV